MHLKLLDLTIFLVDYSKNCPNEIGPVLHTIFVQSINDGVIPFGWSLAYVTPVFKKGNKNLAEFTGQFH